MLKALGVLSQRDPQWANILLGYNKNLPYTIGNYGCLITTLGNYIGKTPTEVNEILKANNGFTKDSGDLIWGQVTALGLNQEYISPKYEDAVTSQGLQKVKDFLDQGFPLVCEVDFNPNTEGEEMHFVLLIGYEGSDFYAVDPWVGQIINVSVYGGPARAIIQFKAFDKKLEIIGTTPTVNADEQRGIDNLKIYRADPNQNKEGEEGNFEGFVARLIGRDRMWLQVQTDLDNARKAADKANALNTELSGQIQGFKTTIEDWEKFRDKLWDLLNPVNKDKTTANILGEVSELIQKESNLIGANKDTSNANKKYDEFLVKVKKASNSTGTTENEVIKSIETLATIPASNSTLPIDTTPKKGLLQKIVDFFKSLKT